MVKREPLTAINENRDIPELRQVKREKTNRKKGPVQTNGERPAKRSRSGRKGTGAEPVQQDAVERRVLRSHYLAVKTLINEDKEELCKGDSDRFQSIIREVENLHEYVQNPREQVTDAETLLDIANTLVTTVRSHSKDGLTPSDFISSLIHGFGVAGGMRRMENDNVSIKWKDVGLLVSSIFRKAHGCSTMIGPMNTELKQRKIAVQRRRGRSTERAARPEQLENTEADQKTDTDKNMATMFEILRRKKSVRLENLIVNRFSFAQTVENLFALSFLVKDGRAEIAVNDKGTHLVSPRNAPPSHMVVCGEVVYHHFVFRFDFNNWKLMTDTVGEGQELMPHRYQVSIPLSRADPLPDVTAVAMPTSPIRKLSRNRGRPVTDESSPQLS